MHIKKKNANTEKQTFLDRLHHAKSSWNSTTMSACPPALLWRWTATKKTRLTNTVSTLPNSLLNQLVDSVMTLPYHADLIGLIFGGIVPHARKIQRLNGTSQRKITMYGSRFIHKAHLLLIGESWTSIAVCRSFGTSQIHNTFGILSAAVVENLSDWRRNWAHVKVWCWYKQHTDDSVPLILADRL